MPTANTENMRLVHIGLSEEWDQCYRERTHLSIWPFSDLVSYVMRYVRPTGRDFSVLELGCGAGANIPFFLSLGVNYRAIEGSATIIRNLHQKYPQLKSYIVCADFTNTIPFSEEFDLVVDRAALTHNSTEGIERCLDMVHRKMKPGSKFIGIDWFSTLHSEYNNGMQTDDAYARSGYVDGDFAHVGQVHFSDKPHLTALFGKFNFTVLEHKILQEDIPDKGLTRAWWNFVAERK